MSYDKPKGKELKVTKSVNELMDKARRITDETGDYPASGITNASITIGHSLEGVRCNGWARLSNVLDVKEQMEFFIIGFKKELKVMEGQYKKLEMIQRKITKQVSTLKLCPNCKGKKGARVKYMEGHIIKNWKDCSDCEGRGIVI